MFSHYFKLARKVLNKNKYYTFINVFGLVCGMLSVLIIAKYIGGSMHFDDFHANKSRLYSLKLQESIEGNPFKKLNSTYWGVGDLVDQYPEVEIVSRYSMLVASLVLTDEENGKRLSFLENRISAADSNFLKIFTFPVVYGNQETALSQENSIVLTRSSALKYFGNTDPTGNVLTIRVPWGLEMKYKVSAVIEDIPQRSQFRFDFLIPQIQPDPEQYWAIPDNATFVLLKENKKNDGLSEKLTGSLNEVEPLKLANKKVIVSLESLASARLTTTEYLLAAVGIFILLISWVNYINQSIAQSYGRFREVGTQRVLGATRNNLRIQFIFESGLICMISLLLVIVIYSGIEPYLQSYTGGHLLPLGGDPTMTNFYFLGIFILGIILAGSIPALVLFSHNFGEILRNKYSTRIGSVGLRNSLVVLQFSISAILVISIFIIRDQLEYMTSKDKGIDMRNTLIVRSPMEHDSWEIKRERLQLFKEKCAELPFVNGITSSTTIPGEEYRHEIYLSFQDNEDKSMVYLSRVDDNFLKLYGVQFIAGHDFVPDAFWKNNKSIILNESAARALGISDFEKIIHSKVVDHESEKVFDLVGVVSDYHKTSLKYEIQPMAFQFNDSWGHISLKVSGSGLAEDDYGDNLESIEKVWDQVYRDVPFDNYFLEERFKSEDREDMYFGNLFEFFTILSIIISCSGLFGLSLLVSMKRQMEISVRKIFGASSMHILSKFLKGYLGSLLAAVLLGTPIAYFLMGRWLRNYTYRIEIGFWPVSLAVLSLTIIFLFTVSFHTIRSSASNPVNILRD